MLALQNPLASRTGEPIHVEWTVGNQGTVPAQEKLVDSVYLSTDGVWDIGDVLVGKVAHTGLLAAGVHVET